MGRSAAAVSSGGNRRSDNQTGPCLCAQKGYPSGYEEFLLPCDEAGGGTLHHASSCIGEKSAMALISFSHPV